VHTRAHQRAPTCTNVHNVHNVHQRAQRAPTCTNVHNVHQRVPTCTTNVQLFPHKIWILDIFNLKIFLVKDHF